MREPGTPVSERFRVGDVVFDAATGEIESARGTLRLQPQPALVLATLVRRGNALVTRDELREAVWPGVVSDTDDGLNFCVRQIRAALGDGVDGARYIETLPRRGYRLVAQVGRESGAAEVTELTGVTEASEAKRMREASAADAPDAATLRGTAARGLGLRRRVIALGVAVAAALALLVSLRAGGSEPASRTVAVLPLATSNAPWSDPINDAITDRLVEFLTNGPAPWGRVVGPVTTRAFANDPRPHTELGAALGVDYVMSGGVRASDSTIFIQAVRSRDGVHVFAWRSRVGGRTTDAVFADLSRALSDRARAW